MKFHNFFLFPKTVAPKFCQNTVFEIVRRVKCNIPEINLKSSFELMPVSPIFVVEEENLNLSFAKSLFLANLIWPFNLVVMFKQKKLFSKILTFATYLKKDNLSKTEKEILYSVNLNFPSSKTLNKIESGIFVNGQKMFHKPVVNNFVESENNYVNIQQFYFNGNYYFFKNKLKNKIIIKKIIYFNKFNYLLLKNNIIFNFNTKEKIYIKCTKKINTKLLRFGNNYLLEIKIESEGEFSLYVGNEKINIFDQKLKEKINYLLNNLFITKIKLKNEKINNLFNYAIPKQIVKITNYAKICDCQNLAKIEKLENDYYFLKEKMIKFSNGKVIFNLGNFVGSCKTCFGGKLKKINFFKTKNLTKKIVCDGVEFQNCKSVTLEVFKNFNHFDVYS